MTNLHYIAFDADDTLWVNEPYFQEAEATFVELIAPYVSAEEARKELFATEMQNLSIYGYGIKAFTLSMLETALHLSDNKLDPTLSAKIIELGKYLHNKPVEVLEGVEEVLSNLSEKYKLVVATKGDLLDQQAKIERSGLSNYFQHAEIMSDKRVDDYRKLTDRLACQPAEFMMIGNSVKSDILPVLELGGYAIHVPYHVTWAHEVIDESVNHPNFTHIEHIVDVLKLVK